MVCSYLFRKLKVGAGPTAGGKQSGGKLGGEHRSDAADFCILLVSVQTEFLADSVSLATREEVQLCPARSRTRPDFHATRTRGIRGRRPQRMSQSRVMPGQAALAQAPSSEIVRSIPPAEV